MDSSTAILPFDFQLDTVPLKYIGTQETEKHGIQWINKSIGGKSTENLGPKLFFTSTHGKYSHPKISLTDALLEERKDEIKREKIKYPHQNNG